MPKRIPTPPPGDDEPRYLTVVHPYAISGTCNMELQKDREDFARWVACCIDKDAFFAIFHKPSVSSTLIDINVGVADDMVLPLDSHEAWSSSKSTEIMRTLTAFSVNIDGPNFFKPQPRKRGDESHKSFTAPITPGGSCRKTVGLALRDSCCGRGSAEFYFCDFTAPFPSWFCSAALHQRYMSLVLMLSFRLEAHRRERSLVQGLVAEQ